jgi:Domain of unknown function (DUF4333)
VDGASNRSRFGAAILAACATLALAACGSDDDDFTLPTTTAATATGATGATGEDGASGTGTAVEEALSEAGFGIAAVDCPDDVPLEEGDTFECEFTVDAGESGTLSITVDSADEETATLSYLGEAGDEPVEGEGVEVQK